MIERPSRIKLRDRQSSGNFVFVLLFGNQWPPAVNWPDSDQKPLRLLFVVPASNNGRRSTARQIFEPECLIGCCSAIERLAAINRATDIRAGVHDCVLFSRSSAERQSICQKTICIHCVLLRALQEPINGKRALQKPIEEKQSRDTESNGGKTLSARWTCGSFAVLC